MLRFDMIAMFEDEETRRIMRTVVMKPGAHVNELIRSANVVQNSFYPRIASLLKQGLLSEKKELNRRQFYPTKKGYRATYEDGTRQGREFLEFLKETAYGKQLLEATDWLEREVMRLHTYGEYERLHEIERRLDHLANRGDKIEEVKETLRIMWNALEKLSRDEEKADLKDLAERLHLLFQFDEDVLGYIRLLGLARFGVDLIFLKEAGGRSDDWLHMPHYMIADAKDNLDADRTKALAVIQAINALQSSQPSKEQLEHRNPVKME